MNKQELDDIKFRLNEGYWGGRVCSDTGCPLKHDCKSLLAEIDRLQAERDNGELHERNTVRSPKPNKRIPGIGTCQICKTELCIDDEALYFCPTCGQRLKEVRDE